MFEIGLIWEETSERKIIIMRSIFMQLQNNDMGKHTFFLIFFFYVRKPVHANVTCYQALLVYQAVISSHNVSSFHSLFTSVEHKLVIVW